MGDPEGFFEALEAFFEGGEGDAEAEVLALVPTCAEAEPGAAAREDVEGGDGFEEDAGVAVGDAGQITVPLSAIIDLA